MSLIIGKEKEREEEEMKRIAWALSASPAGMERLALIPNLISGTYVTQPIIPGA